MGTGTVPERVLRWLPHARAAELILGVDPLLLLAICDRESGGGEYLHPRGPAGKGDSGHGHGLMQLDDRWHPTLIAALAPNGKPLWQLPGFNILAGAQILYDAIHQFDGEGCNPLLAGICAYNASPKRIREVLRSVTRPISDSMLIKMLDPITTGGDYVSSVLAKRKSYVLST